MAERHRDRLPTAIGVVLVAAILGLLWVTQAQLSDSRADRRGLEQSVDVLRTQVQQLGGTPAVGPAGEPGATGLSGQQGDPGSAGATGAVGPIGAPGVDGGQGSAGPAGANGSDGADGTPGADGAPGANGAPGADGTPGTDGAPPSSFTFTFTDSLLVEHTWTCTDPDGDGVYTCTES